MSEQSVVETTTTTRDTSKYAPKYTPITDIIYYAELGLLNKEIAELLNVHESTISRRLTDYGYVRESSSRLGSQYKLIATLINDGIVNNLKEGKIKFNSFNDVKQAMISSGIAHDHYLDATGGKHAANSGSLIQVLINVDSTDRKSVTIDTKAINKKDSR
jgi:hypothetical protein